MGWVYFSRSGLAIIGYFQDMFLYVRCRGLFEVLSRLSRFLLYYLVEKRFALPTVLTFGCLCRTGGFCWCVLLGVDFYWLNCISGFLWSDCHCSFCLHGLVLMSSTRRFQYLSIPVDGTVKIGNACIWLLARSSQPTEPRVST